MWAGQDHRFFTIRPAQFGCFSLHLPRVPAPTTSMHRAAHSRRLGSSLTRPSPTFAAWPVPHAVLARVPVPPNTAPSWSLHRGTPRPRARLCCLAAPAVSTKDRNGSFCTQCSSAVPQARAADTQRAWAQAPRRLLLLRQRWRERALSASAAPAAAATAAVDGEMTKAMRARRRTCTTRSPRPPGATSPTRSPRSTSTTTAALECMGRFCTRPLSLRSPPA